MITHEQVADLQPGDVVELTSTRWPDVMMRGPLHDYRGYLSVGPWAVRNPDGSPYADLGEKSTRTLTVIFRVPRPLYVNYPRTEPATGDIVRDCDGDAWRFDRNEWWCASPDAVDGDSADPIESFRPLILLWDGETGQVVP